jgi:hypothetical protein
MFLFRIPLPDIPLPNPAGDTLRSESWLWLPLAALLPRGLSGLSSFRSFAAKAQIPGIRAIRWHIPKPRQSPNPANSGRKLLKGERSDCAQLRSIALNLT